MPHGNDPRAEHVCEMPEHRLLIRNGEPPFGRFVHNIAEQPGYAVQIMTDRQAFMRAYETSKPSMIIFDMVLPLMDGNELIYWLAERRCSARLS